MANMGRMGWEPKDNNLVYSSKNFEHHDSSEVPNAREDYELEIEKLYQATRKKNEMKHEATDEVKLDGEDTERQDSDKADNDINKFKKYYSGGEDVPAKFKRNDFF